MTNYILIDEDTNKVWNFRTQKWANTVTNGCRYKGCSGGRWVGVTSPKSAQKMQDYFFNNGISVCIMNEEYMMKNHIRF